METLFKASAYVLGSSGVAIVYKVVLQDGATFTVRRIREGGVGRCKEFKHQVKAIAKLRHQNLVRVRGFCWGENEKLVIREYISNGSLANVGCTRERGGTREIFFVRLLERVQGAGSPEIVRFFCPESGLSIEYMV